MRFSAVILAAVVPLMLPEIGCLVSFDGYGPLLDSPDAGQGGASAVGGTTASGGERQSGGATSSGGLVSGTGGVAPQGGAGGGTASGGSGAVAGTGNGGTSSVGGSPSTGGASSGTGGRASGGTSGAGGNGTGGISGTGGTVTTGGAMATGGSPGTGGTAPITCPVGLAGPPMAEVPKPGGGIFCIDRTEITNEAYAAFLASSPGVSGQIAVCSWNTSFLPEKGTDCDNPQYDPAGAPKVPIACIDWCDARRYCEWAGKRLCGAVAGGAATPSRFADATNSQWFAACSMGGVQRFPYGDTYDEKACAGSLNSGTHPGPVSSLPKCRGGYDGIYDMSGNVAEWEDSCTAATGKGDACLIRGGSFYDDERTAPTLLCNSSPLSATTASPATSARDTRSELIGLRCCFDP